MSKDYYNFIADTLQIQIKEEPYGVRGAGNFVTSAGVPYTVEIVSSLKDINGGIGVLCSLSGDLYAYLYVDDFNGLGGELHLLDGKKLNNKELPLTLSHSVALGMIKKAIVKSYTSSYLDTGWVESGVKYA